MNFTNSVIISLILLAFSFSFNSCSYKEIVPNSTEQPEHAHVPCAERIQLYSFPLEEPVEYICCTNAPSPELAPLFNVQGRTLKSDMSMDTSCVRLDTLSPMEKIRIRSTTLTAANSCRTFQGAFEHFPCECRNTCDDPDYTCNCPGVPKGELPMIVQQDSLRSKPEFLSTSCTPCGSLSTCCD